MISLKIGSVERKDGNIEERWIAQQIRKRREDGNPICVQAVIHHCDVNIVPTSAACKGTGAVVGASPIGKNRSFLDYGTKEA